MGRTRFKALALEHIVQRSFTIPSPEEVESMKTNFLSVSYLMSETFSLSLVRAASQSPSKQEAMNRQHIDEAQILHIVNPDGTSKDGWWPQVRNMN